MPEEYKVQDTTFYKPQEGEVWTDNTPGSGGRYSIYQTIGNKTYRLKSANFTGSRNTSTLNAYNQALLDDMGIDNVNKLATYNTADLGAHSGFGWGGERDYSSANSFIDSNAKYYQGGVHGLITPTGQGLQDYTSQVSPDISFQNGRAVTSETQKDLSLSPQETQRITNEATAAGYSAPHGFAGDTNQVTPTTQPGGTTAPLTQPTQQTQPADPQLMQKIEGTDPNLQANDDYINAVFKAIHGRDATAGDLASFKGRTTGDVLNTVRQTVVAQDPTQAPSQLPAGYQHIKNQAELGLLQGEGLTEDNIFRDPLSSRMYYNPDFKPKLADVAGLSDMQTASDGLSEEFQADLTQIDYEGTGNAMLDEIKDRLKRDIGFNARIQAEMETKYGIEGMDSALVDIDKQIATLTQSMNLGLNNIQNQPISLAQITGQQAHMRRTVGAELEGLSAVKESLLGERTLAEGRMNRAIDAMTADKQYEHDLLQSFYDETKADLDKQEAREWDLFLAENERQIEEEKWNKQQVGNIMLSLAENGMSAGISLNDSFDEALNKAAPAFASMRLREMMASQDTEPKNYGTSDNPNWGIYDPNTNSVIPVSGLALTSINGNLPDPNKVLSFEDATKWGVQLGTTYSELLDQQSDEAVDGLMGNLNLIEDILNNPFWKSVVGTNFLGNNPGTSGLLPGVVNVRNNIKTLLSSQVLQNLIDAKRNGATFGALSEKELLLLQQAASPLASANQYDDSGRLKMGEKEFLSIMNKMRDGYYKNILKAKGYDYNELNAIKKEYSNNPASMKDAIINLPNQSIYTQASQAYNNFSPTLQEVVRLPENGDGGQCGRFVNDITQRTTGTRLGLGDSYTSKMNLMTIKNPKPEQISGGMVFVTAYKNTGHTGFILSNNGDGTVTVRDSNYGLDERIRTHEIPISSIKGVRLV